MKLICGCHTDGCFCLNEVNVPRVASKDALVICSDCSSGKHTIIGKNEVQTQNSKPDEKLETRVDMFVQSC